MMTLIRIAFRNVLRNRRRSILTLAAVFLAVGVLVAVHGLMNGMQATIRDGVIRGQVGAIQIHKKGFLKQMQGSPLELNFPVDDKLLDRIAAVPGVTAAAARIPFGGMVNANDTTVFALFQGLDPAREAAVCPQRYENLNAGSPLDPKAPDHAVLSDELAHRIGMKMGDVAAVLGNDAEGVLNGVEVKFAGQMGLGGLPLPDKKIAWVSLASAQELLRLPGRATEIAVAVQNLDDVPKIVPLLQALMGPAYEVSAWNEVATFVEEMVKNQNASMGLIGNIFLFIALIGIANTMLMNVLERTREIGTMMSVGLRRRQLLLLFLLEAALLGFAGGVAGSAVAEAIVLHYGHVGMRVYAAGSDVPFNIHPFVTIPYLLQTFATAALGAAAAALYPAWWASRLRPVEALGAT